MKEKVKAKWEKALTDLELISAGDEVQESVMANWLEITAKIFGTWVKGEMVFTKQRLVFVSTFAASSFSLRYSDIKEIEKCNISWFFPMGIIIEAVDPETGKEKSYRCSVSKRAKWIAYLSEKTGISCS